jgi:pimeloyl-ACP methyl ester carboxylesterase
MREPETYPFVSQGLRLNVCAWGKPESPTLILLHGVRDHARSWDKIASAFAENWRVLAPDLRGHGDSDWARGGFYPTEGHIFDLAELATRLDRFALLGHSLGGNIALRYAALFPEKVTRVIAIEGLSHSPKSVAERQAKPIETHLRDWIERQREIAARPPRRYATLDEAIARVRGEHPRLDPDFVAHLARCGVRDNPDGTFSFKFDPALRVFPPVELGAEDAARLWSLVLCPALLVYGADSWASNPLHDGRARHFRNAEAATLESAGHWAHHDQRDAFLSLAQRFLGA